MAKIALGLVPTSGASASESSGTGSLSSNSSTSTSNNDPQPGSRSTETVATGGASHIVSSVAKRGRLLIRQQRIKKESDSSASGQQPYEPDTPSDDNSPTAIVYAQQHLLTVPSAHHRFERQVSEPIMPLSASVVASSVIGGPISSSTGGGDGRHGHERSSAGGGTASGHLLSVPSSHQPYLVKQHSHPLLPSQTSSSAISHTAITGQHHQSFQTITSYTLQRQLSHPATTLVTGVSGSGTAHYLTPSSSLKTDSDEEGGSNVTVTLSTTTSSSTATTTTATTTATTTTIIPTIQLQPIGDRPAIEGSPTVVVVPADPVTTVTTTCPVSSNSNSGAAQSTITSISSTPSSSIRVKGEELSRSISTPLTSSRSSDIPGLDNPRSSHCPVVREGPALGCNFCWNTIDAHGRILRRKTKYHCPECQTNLCIVPCFQEYHERQSAENAASTGDGSSSGAGGGGSSVTKSGLRHYAKSGSM